jgi:CheY-like chemotaxis protein
LYESRRQGDNTPVPSSTIIAIGDPTAPDLRAAVDWLAARGATFFDTPAAALWQASSPPHWIYLLCERRGVFAQSEIEALHRAAPLARLVAVCGSWCEGEPRTGRVLSGVTRVYAHQFTSRAIAAEDASDFAGWRLPRTATPIDVSLQRVRWAPLAAKIGVIAETRSDFESLADALSGIGCHAVWEKRDPSLADVAAIVRDGRSLDERALADLRRARDFNKPLVALLHWARADEISGAKELGASDVVSKPFLLGDLYAALQSLAGAAHHERAA